jgi:anti-anti-sigma regulatory factor
MTLFMSATTHGSSQPAWELGCHHRHWNGHCEQGAFVAVIATRYLFDDVLADGFLADLVAAIQDCGARSAILDFQHVEAASQAALDALSQLSAWLGQRGGRLVLCGLCGPLIEQCHLAELTGTGPWKGEPDVAAAMADLSQPRRQ